MINEAKRKKRQLFFDMTRSLDLKKEKEYQERMDENRENRRRWEYLQEKERRENAEKEHKRKLDLQR